MGNASRLVKAMQRASQPKQNELTDIVVGTVTSISPLKIKVDKIELTETFLILSPLCVERKIQLPDITNSSHTHTIPGHSTSSESVESLGKHSHTVSEMSTDAALSKISRPEIQLWRGLKVKDSVLMLKCSKGQKYYVLQRKEGIV